MDRNGQTAHPELLAPAGSWEALVAAVQNGADAVYLGAHVFNARQSAANFDEDELVRAIDYAHVRGVNVYVTVNILLADTELEAAGRLLHFLYRAGADGVIIQDLGLARLARELVPGLPLHASTQMTVHNLSTVLFLKELGFARIVLARELALDEIKELRAQGGLQVESFVHGALCVCYSGQCLMSSFIGARSGNRGRCAQPCRLPYDLMDGQNGEAVAQGYLLSTRDLNLAGHLPDLVAAGIDAFKIEGRLRRPEYVAIVVGLYRRLLDRALAGAFFIAPEEERDLAQIFNRRFTTGYYYGKPGRDLVNFKQPNNRGLPVGRVRSYDAQAGMAQIALEGQLRPGDGVDFWVTVGGRISTEVHRLIQDGKEVAEAGPGMLVGVPVKGRIHAGDRVFKTWDAALLRRARETFTSAHERKRIPLVSELRAEVGKPLYLSLKDEQGRTASFTGAMPLPLAQKHPATREGLAEQLDRLGNTPFFVERLLADVDGRAMVPRSELNAARRVAVDALIERRAADRRPGDAVETPVFAGQLTRFLASGKVTPKGLKDGQKPLLAVAVSSLEAVSASLRGGADIVYFPGEGLDAPGRIGEQELVEAQNRCLARGARFVYWIPRIVGNAETGRYLRLAQVVKEGDILAGNLGLAVELAMAGYAVWADYPVNIFNRVALELLAQHGVRGACLSPEMTMDQVRTAAGRSPLPLEALVHGSVPLMVSKYCVVGAAGGACTTVVCRKPCHKGRFYLQDRLGISFPVAVDNACRMHIFNSRDLCAVKQVPVLSRAGLRRLRLDGRLKSPDDIARTTAVYRRVLDSARFGDHHEEELLNEAQKDLAALSPGGLTRGHYFRGVL